MIVATVFWGYLSRYEPRCNICVPISYWWRRIARLGISGWANEASVCICLRESGTLISRHGGQTHAYRNNTGRGVFLRCVFRIRGTSGGGNILAY